MLNNQIIQNVLQNKYYQVLFFESWVYEIMLDLCNVDVVLSVENFNVECCSKFGREVSVWDCRKEMIFGVVVYQGFYI